MIRHNESLQSSNRKTARNYTEENANFISQLCDFLCDSITLNANFYRRTTSLECLNLLSTIMTSDLTNLYTNDNAENLRSILEDSYERNQDLALALSLKFPPHLTGFACKESVIKEWEKILEKCDMINPSHPSNAGFRLLLILQSPGFKETFACDNPPKTALEMLSKRLKEQIMNLEQINLTMPMYGILLCMRKIVESLVRRENQDYLKRWTEETISICRKVWDLLAPVLNSESPEGFVYDEVGI